MKKKSAIALIISLCVIVIATMVGVIILLMGSGSVNILLNDKPLSESVSLTDMVPGSPEVFRYSVESKNNSKLSMLILNQSAFAQCLFSPRASTAT